MTRLPRPPAHLTLAERMELYTEKSATCWLWVGPRKEQDGYGRLGFQCQDLFAHRVAWELANGREIPPGLSIDHLCRNKLCVNPFHLEPVTPAENSRRANLRAKCANGHPLTPENVYTRPKTGGRRCKTCRDKRRAASYEIEAVRDGRRSIKWISERLEESFRVEPDLIDRVRSERLGIPIQTVSGYRRRTFGYRRGPHRRAS